MKQADWNHSILNNIDPALVEGASAPAGRRNFHPLRIVAAAACMCALLAGMALAAETIFGIPIFKPVETNPFTGEEFNGFTTVIDAPKGTVSGGTYKQPVDSFSPAVRELAAALEQENQELQEDIDSLGTAGSVVEIAQKLWDLVFPDTVVIEPEE